MTGGRTLSSSPGTFDWAGYLEFASALAKSAKTEAEFRSVVSRAYYACFGVARRELRSRSLLPPGGNENDHRRVPDVLREQPGRTFVAASTHLTRLRRLRNMADYDQTFPNPRQEALSAVAVAQAAMSSLDACWRSGDNEPGTKH